MSNGATVTYAAKAAIVTVPLGVLKRRGPALFSPALPKPKQDAINRLGVGLLNKVFLEWSPSYTGGPFKAPDGGKYWLNRLPLLSGDSGRWKEFFNLKKAIGVPVLVAYMAGQPAVDTELGMTDAAAVTSVSRRHCHKAHLDLQVGAAPLQRHME